MVQAAEYLTQTSLRETRLYSQSEAHINSIVAERGSAGNMECHVCRP